MTSYWRSCTPRDCCSAIRHNRFPTRVLLNNSGALLGSKSVWVAEPFAKFPSVLSSTARSELASRPVLDCEVGRPRARLLRMFSGWTAVCGADRSAHRRATLGGNSSQRYRSTSQSHHSNGPLFEGESPSVTLRHASAPFSPLHRNQFRQP